MNYKHDCNCIAHYTQLGRVYNFHFFSLFHFCTGEKFSKSQLVYRHAVLMAVLLYCSSLNLIFSSFTFYFGCSTLTVFRCEFFFVYLFHSFFMHHNCDFLPFSMCSLCTLFLKRFLSFWLLWHSVFCVFCYCHYLD